MLTRRIIPCLDVSHGRVVKGVKFEDLRDAGDPAALAALYAAQGADEIVVLDVSATNEARANQVETIHRVRAALAIPLTVGGGVRVADDAARLLDAGADKVSVNTAAVLTPELLDQMARRFGAQCTVVAIDAAQTAPGVWEVVTHSGKTRTGLNVLEWAAQAEARGAGEILLTSFDRDGTRSGYDLALLRAVSARVRVPIIASGGAASPDHMVAALEAGADAVLAASIFHDGEMTVEQVKRALSAQNVEIRR
jgi:imidazoleglycerol phosphate synthase cyclase subunit